MALLEQVIWDMQLEKRGVTLRRKRQLRLKMFMPPCASQAFGPE
jgi:hypothetical protein